MDSTDWIPFGEGEYWVEQAVLFTPENSAARLEETTVEVFKDRTGKKRMKGSGKVKNILVVELLENSEDIHLLLDLGGEFKYRLEEPKLFAGKVFSPDVKSVLRFFPTAPWEQLTNKEFEKSVMSFEFIE